MVCSTQEYGQKIYMIYTAWQKLCSDVAKVSNFRCKNIPQAWCLCASMNNIICNYIRSFQGERGQYQWAVAVHSKNPESTRRHEIPENSRGSGWRSRWRHWHHRRSQGQGQGHVKVMVKVISRSKPSYEQLGSVYDLYVLYFCGRKSLLRTYHGHSDHFFGFIIWSWCCKHMSLELIWRFRRIVNKRQI